MKKFNLAFMMLFVLVASTTVTSFAQKAKAVAPTKNIVETAVGSADHSTLVAAVTAAGLVETLSSTGPFTVFAPTNAAFDKLPAGTVATLVKPENKATLTGILTYHVLSGKFDAKSVVAAITKGKGKAEFTTVAGGKLTGMIQGKDVILMDESGNTAKVTVADLMTTNGVIHVIDTVLLPKSK